MIYLYVLYCIVTPKLYIVYAFFVFNESTQCFKLQ